MKKRTSTVKEEERHSISSSSVQELYNHGNISIHRISDLPDELLCHILSFLPTKLAFTTTAFSKRWTRLCYSLPVLQFQDENIKDWTTFDKFCHFVDNFMLSPLSINQPLKSFHLIVNRWCGRNHKRDCHTFNTWLEAAKKRHVEEFHLNLCHHTLNTIIFISQTLVVLKLECLQLAIDTSCVDLPSLKTLLLKSVNFQNRNDYISFISACPNLEDLHAKSIYMYGNMNRDQNIAPEEGFKSLTLSKLVKVNISLMDAHVFGHRSLDCWEGVLELLRHCPKLQILYIDKWMNTISSKEWKCPISVLECVSSHLRSCTILNFQGSENDLKFVTYILQNANLLRNMKIGFSTYGMLLEKSLIIEELSSYSRISPRCNISFEFQ